LSINQHTKLILIPGIVVYSISDVRELDKELRVIDPLDKPKKIFVNQLIRPRNLKNKNFQD
jgi:hypothetical protein